MSKLTEREIKLITEHYIGVEGGYLGDFENRRTLKEFYQVDCDLDIDPSYDFGGTIREEFINILKSQSTHGQARILRTVLGRFYLESARNGPQTTQEKLHERLAEVATRLESESTFVENVTPPNPSESVRFALEEAEDLVRRGRISSAVDRTHTALHGHIKDLCDEWAVEYENGASLTKVFKVLRQNHPAFREEGPRQQDINKIVSGLATALDGLNTIRNKASLSHPQDALLAEAEATLAINATRSIFHYLEDKLAAYADDKKRPTKHLTIDDILF